MCGRGARLRVVAVAELAAEELDLALRTAFFADSECITLRHEVLRAAAGCPALDVERLAADLDAGIARHAMIRQTATARAHEPGSCTGYLVLPDGTGCCNPGVTIRWTEPGIPRGVPVLQADEPDVYVELVATAAGQTT